MPLHRVHAVAVMDGTLLFGENNGAASRTVRDAEIGVPEKISKVSIR